MRMLLLAAVLMATPAIAADDVRLGEPRITYSALASARAIYEVTNATGAPVDVSVQCGLYDGHGNPLAVARGYTEAVPANGRAVGQAIAHVDEKPAKAECRVTDIGTSD